MGIKTPPQPPHSILIIIILKSMSQDFHHQGIFSFSNGFERYQQQQQQQQIRRENKLSVHGFMEEEEETGGLPVYETGGASTMMSEIFNFPSDGAVSATELLETQISQSYRNSRAAPPTSGADWFSHRINAESEAAMQLFPTPPNPTSSTLHMLLPNPSSSSSFGQFTWFNPNENNNINNNPNEIPPGVVEGQRLSLSLSSSLQHMGGGAGLHLHGGVRHNRHSSNFTAAASMLRNSKYAKVAQDLLEEFCSVGSGQFKKNKFPNNHRNTSGGAASGGGGGDGNAAQDHPPLSASDRLEHQRRKVKLLAMLDEVDRRYNHYCEQMQMVVNSFDMMMGFGAAAPYTSLAQKAMSRHFRCLKDAIAAQLKHSCELLGEKDGAGTSGVTKGETPRLRILEQSLRQQRAFQQMGIMEQEAWRPQRGLPERSVNVLRAWLFEHFLHPYPSDADKHLLARQTGLSRNQVSNWFINARVRLWKPMVEDMYQQEAKEQEKDQTSSNTTSPDNNAQIPTPPPPTTATATTSTTATFTTPPAGKRPEINAHENDPSFVAINAHFFSENQANYNNVSVPGGGGGGATSSAAAQSFPAGIHETDTWRKHAVNRFGTSGGDVSLTLGLRHGAGNLPEKSHNFSVRDFGSC